METDAYIMVVDDESSVREALSNWMRQLGFKVTTLENGEAALKLYNERQWNTVFLDMTMPGISGLEVMAKMREQNPSIPVILLADSGNVAKAVKALDNGASDYMVKPLTMEEVSHFVRRVLAFQELEQEVTRLKQRMDAMYEFDEMMGRSPAMRAIFEKVNEVAQGDGSVLIRGEPGTGKESIARSIHARSARRYMPFVIASFGAIPMALLESELFGHEKGAFTGAAFTKKGRFELAHKGTLLLDAIGRITPKTQLDLTLALNEKSFRRVGGTQLIKFDARLIAATSKNLEYLVEAKQFREDLLQHLNSSTIIIPPLRERIDDIPLLAEHFLQKYVTKTNKRIRRFNPAAMDLLRVYPWPGNVRELKNAVERSVIQAESDEITPDELPFTLRGYLENAATKSIKEWEKVHISRVLNENDWNISKSAKDLKIDRVTLYNKIKKYKIDRPKKA